LELNSFDPNSQAARVIDFIADLFGMDRFYVPLGNAAIDLHSGLIVRPHEEFPDGEKLKLEYAPGANPDRTEVHTHKLMESLLVRHAEALAITNPEGGNARAHYAHIADHFQRKTEVIID
jgi:hypothetical protein